MDAIPMSRYRRRQGGAARVRDGGGRVPASVFVPWRRPDEQVLADLFSAQDVAAAGRILARYARVAALIGSLPRAPLDWSVFLEDTEEGTALARAQAARPASALRYCALLVAARDAARAGQRGGTFALCRLAYLCAVAARRKAAAARAAAAVSAAAAATGARGAARAWRARARQLSGTSA